MARKRRQSNLPLNTQPAVPQMFHPACAPSASSVVTLRLHRRGIIYERTAAVSSLDEYLAILQLPARTFTASQGRVVLNYWADRVYNTKTGEVTKDKGSLPPVEVKKWRAKPEISRDDILGALNQLGYDAVDQKRILDTIRAVKKNDKT